MLPLGRMTHLTEDWRTWTTYATKADGTKLECSVTYSHTVRGEWTWREVSPDGKVRDLYKKGRLGKEWTLTDDGLEIIAERKAGTL
jgi:hypothetical protein